MTDLVCVDTIQIENIQVPAVTVVVSHIFTSDYCIIMQITITDYKSFKRLIKYKYCLWR